MIVSPEPPTTLAGATRKPGLGLILRSVTFTAVFYLHLLATLLIATPIALFLPRRACFALARGWALRSLWLLRAICRTGVEFRGLENLPSCAFILATKHQSMWETFAYLSVLAQPAHVMKRELAWVPLWNLWAWKTGMIIVSRGKRSVALEQLMRGARRAIADGRPIIIAPEGHRTAPGAPPKYKYGVAHLYGTLDVVVVPAALNSGLYWSRWSPIRYPGTILVSFLRPIPPGLEPADFLARLTADIEGECDRLFREALASA